MTVNLTEAYSEKIVWGREAWVSALPSAMEMPIVGGDHAAQLTEGPSIVWINDRLDRVIQRLCIEVKNVPNLRRLLVFTQDAQVLAGLMKNPAYHFLFSHPALKIAILNTGEELRLNEYSHIFNVTTEDRMHHTNVFNAIDLSKPGATEFAKRIFSLHQLLISLELQGGMSLGNTVDNFMGFRASVENVCGMLQTPDLRKARTLGRGQAAVLVGAGPSVKSQFDFLKSIEKNVWIFAADTMLSPLSKAGIVPDFICSIERGENVLTLMDPERDHAQTILLAANVLDPRNFKLYRGPHSICYTDVGFNEWIGIPRMKHASGHSCMGMAMSLAMTMECDPVLLMGIDLCWADDGRSHVDTTPYLEKDFYKQSNQWLLDNSYFATNLKGEQVRTSHFWTLFRSQFEIWARSFKSQIFNLSPAGLPIEGSTSKTPDQIVGERILVGREKRASIDLHGLAYDQDQVVRKALEGLVERATKSIEEIESLSGRISSKSIEAIRSEFDSSWLRSTILYPLVGPSLNALSAPDVAYRTLAKLSIEEHLAKVKDCIQREIPNWAALARNRDIQLY